MIDGPRVRRGVAASFLIFAAAAASAQPTTGLRLASDVWPPFTDEPGGRRVAIELVEAALERVEVEVGTEIRSDFGQVMSGIRAGELDGSAALWRNQERESFLVFSRPYLENRLVLLARKGTEVSAASLAAVGLKRIGIVESYAYGDALDKASGPIFIEGPSDQENLQRLLRGAVDYILADELLIHDLFERNARAEVLLEAGATPMLERSLHFGIRRDLAGSQAIVDRFDAAIREMIADGTYNQILGVVWIRADVDGDGESELVLGGEQAGSSAPDDGYSVFRREPAGVEGDRKAPYVVGGEKYESWNQIPPSYRVPVTRESRDRGPGYPLFTF